MPFIGIGYFLSKWSSRAALATYVLAGFIIFIGFATFPTYPRYKFEKETLSHIDKIPLAYVSNRTPWGAITEPLTWFFDFTGSFHVVSFHSQLDALGISKDLSVPRRFKSIVLRYEETPSVSLIDAFCDDQEYSRGVPDAKGVFRLTSRDWQKMDDRMYQVYCAFDWPNHVQMAYKRAAKSNELGLTERIMTFLVCERENYWTYDINRKSTKGVGWVRRETPSRYKTVCGLSGSASKFVVKGPGPFYDKKGRLISKDAVIPGENVKAECREKMPPFYDKNGMYAWERPFVWAREPGGLYCKLKPS